MSNGLDWSCTIKRQSEAETDAGEDAATFSNQYTGVPCSAPGDPAGLLQYTSGGKQFTADYACWVDGEQDVVAGTDRIVFDDDSASAEYEVVSVRATGFGSGPNKLVRLRGPVDA